MSTASEPLRCGDRRGGVRFWFGLLLASCGVVITLTAVVTVDDSRTVGRGLKPWPDAPELLDVAVNLVRTGSLRIHVAGEAHPSRYPPGFSLLIAAALASGVEPAAAPHMVNKVAALLLLLVVALAPGVRGRPLESGLAVLLLATLPAFVVLGRSPMSEMSSTVLVISAVFLLYEYSRAGQRRGTGVDDTKDTPEAEPGDGSWRRVLPRGALGAALLGSSLFLRVANVLPACFLVAAVCARYPQRRWRLAVRDLAILGVVFLVFALPVMVFNATAYGSPLATGYGYWIPYWNLERSFDLRFLGPNLAYLCSELTESETVHTTASIYGSGSYLHPALVLAGLLAAAGLRWTRRAWCFGGAAAVNAWLLLLYFHQDARLMFAVMVLAIPYLATGVVGLWRGTRRLAGAGLVATALLMVAVIGWPAAGGGVSLGELLRPEPAPAPFSVRLMPQLCQLIQAEEPRRPLVLTEMPPPLVHSQLPEGTIVVPVKERHRYRFNRLVFECGPDRRMAHLEKALAEGRPVLAVHRFDIQGLRQDVPVPPDYAWEIVVQEKFGGGIARLVPREPESD